jgi:hypothetical protein
MRDRRKPLDAKTVQAIGELVRAGYKHLTGEDPVEPLEFTICRGPSWCGVEDDYAEVNEEDFNHGEN